MTNVRFFNCACAQRGHEPYEGGGGGEDQVVHGAGLDPESPPDGRSGLH